VYARAFELAGLGDSTSLHALTEGDLDRASRAGCVPILPEHRQRLLAASAAYSGRPASRVQQQATATRTPQSDSAAIALQRRLSSGLSHHPHAGSSGSAAGRLSNNSGSGSSNATPRSLQPSPLQQQQQQQAWGGRALSAEGSQQQLLPGAGSLSRLESCPSEWGTSSGTRTAAGTSGAPTPSPQPPAVCLPTLTCTEPAAPAAHLPLAPSTAAAASSHNRGSTRPATLRFITSAVATPSPVVSAPEAGQPPSAAASFFGLDDARASAAWTSGALAAAVAEARRGAAESGRMSAVQEELMPMLGLRAASLTAAPVETAGRGSSRGAAAPASSASARGGTRAGGSVPTVFATATAGLAPTVRVAAAVQPPAPAQITRQRSPLTSAAAALSGGSGGVDNEEVHASPLRACLAGTRPRAPLAAAMQTGTATAAAGGVFPLAHHRSHPLDRDAPPRNTALPPSAMEAARSRTPPLGGAHAAAAHRNAAAAAAVAAAAAAAAHHRPLGSEPQRQAAYAPPTRRSTEALAAAAARVRSPPGTAPSGRGIQLAAARQSPQQQQQQQQALGRRSSTGGGAADPSMPRDRGMRAVSGAGGAAAVGASSEIKGALHSAHAAVRHGSRAGQQRQQHPSARAAAPAPGWRGYLDRSREGTLQPAELQNASASSVRQYRTAAAAGAPKPAEQRPQRGWLPSGPAVSP